MEIYDLFMERLYYYWGNDFKLTTECLHWAAKGNPFSQSISTHYSVNFWSILYALPLSVNKFIRIECKWRQLQCLFKSLQWWLIIEELKTSGVEWFDKTISMPTRHLMHFFHCNLLATVILLIILLQITTILHLNQSALQIAIWTHSVFDSTAQRLCCTTG